MLICGVRADLVPAGRRRALVPRVRLHARGGRAVLGARGADADADAGLAAAAAAARRAAGFAHAVDQSVFAALSARYERSLRRMLRHRGWSWLPCSALRSSAACWTFTRAADARSRRPTDRGAVRHRHRGAGRRDACNTWKATRASSRTSSASEMENGDIQRVHASACPGRRSAAARRREHARSRSSC